MTSEQIEQLKQEAAQAGNLAQVEICERALDGDESAVRECERVVREAAAQE